MMNIVECNSQAKNSPDTEKTGRFLFVIIFYQIVKKFETLNSTMTKSTCIMRKSTKNYI